MDTNKPTLTADRVASILENSAQHDFDIRKPGFIEFMGRRRLAHGPKLEIYSPSDMRGWISAVSPLGETGNVAHLENRWNHLFANLHAPVTFVHRQNHPYNMKKSYTYSSQVGQKHNPDYTKDPEKQFGNLTKYDYDGESLDIGEEVKDVHKLLNDWSRIPNLSRVVHEGNPKVHNIDGLRIHGYTESRTFPMTMGDFKEHQDAFFNPSHGVHPSVGSTVVQYAHGLGPDRWGFNNRLHIPKGFIHVAETTQDDDGEHFKHDYMYDPSYENLIHLNTTKEDY